MIFRPHSYQSYAIQRIIEQPAVALFLDMGMGKTVCTLTAISELLHNRFEADRVLVIAPLRVAEDTWGREAGKWDHTQHLTISKVLGPEKARKAALDAAADVYIINRENVEWLVKLYGRKWPFDMVVIDELSSFKSPAARRFKALRKVRPLIRRVVGLTGTPAPNGLLDLWAQVYLLDQGERLYRTVTAYRDTYFQPDKRNRSVIYSWAPRAGAGDTIHNKISDLCVSMRASDWLELPDKIDNVVPVILSDEAKARYQMLERDLLLPLGDVDIVANTAAALSNKLLQMANGAVYDEHKAVQEIHQAKLDVLDDIIEAANGKPVLIYYAYKHDLARIQQRIPNCRVLVSAGDIADWISGNVPVMAAHPASAGHGLNLQAGGHTIVWYGLTWSLELYQQANARLYRQGQQHSVIIHHLVAEGTIDEDVMRVLSKKESGQDELLAAVKARINRVREARY